MTDVLLTSEKYSASFAFFEGLWEVCMRPCPFLWTTFLRGEQAGVTHVFVNLGSDHPAIMEALAHGAHLKGVNFPKVITCPHEVCAPTALSPVLYASH